MLRFVTIRNDAPSKPLEASIYNAERSAAQDSDLKEASYQYIHAVNSYGSYSCEKMGGAPPSYGGLTLSLKRESVDLHDAFG
jgi:hypothetical protein